MSVKVTIEDKGAKEVFARLKELKGHKITIGFQGADGSKKHPGATLNVATIALYNEFGTDAGNPSRPFMRSTIFENRARIARMAAALYKSVITGKRSPLKASSELGEFVAKLMVERIDNASSWAEPNKEATIERKGHSRPLLGGDPQRSIAPGTMRDSISWAVKKNGSVLARGKP